MREADFITNIADLKQWIKEAEAAVENNSLSEYRFRILKPLHNTGGFGDHEEHLGDCYLGVINLDRERLKQKESDKKKLSEIKLGDYCDAPEYAPNNCTVIGIWEKMVWLLMPKGGTTVAPPEGIVLHCDKIRSATVDDEIIKACSGLLGKEMRDHLEMYHPHRGHKFIECSECGRFFKILYPSDNVCTKCYLERAKCDGIAEACYSKEMREHIEEYHPRLERKALECWACGAKL